VESGDVWKMLLGAVTPGFRTRLPIGIRELRSKAIPRALGSESSAVGSPTERSSGPPVASATSPRLPVAEDSTDSPLDREASNEALKTYVRTLIDEVIELGDKSLSDECRLVEDLDSAIAMDNVILHCRTLAWELGSRSGLYSLTLQQSKDWQDLQMRLDYLKTLCSDVLAPYASE